MRTQAATEQQPQTVQQTTVEQCKIHDCLFNGRKPTVANTRTSHEDRDRKISFHLHGLEDQSLQWMIWLETASYPVLFSGTSHATLHSARNFKYRVPGVASRFLIFKLPLIVAVAIRLGSTRVIRLWTATPLTVFIRGTISWKVDSAVIPIVRWQSQYQLCRLSWWWYKPVWHVCSSVDVKAITNNTLDDSDRSCRT